MGHRSGSTLHSLRLSWRLRSLAVPICLTEEAGEGLNSQEAKAPRREVKGAKNFNGLRNGASGPVLTLHSLRLPWRLRCLAVPICLTAEAGDGLNSQEAKARSQRGEESQTDRGNW